METHGMKPNAISSNLWSSNEVRRHNMMMKLYEANGMSWNVVASDDCILQQSFWIHPSFRNIKVDISCVKIECFIL